MNQEVLDTLLNDINSFEGKYNVNFDGNGKLITDITSITCHMINEKNCPPEWGGYLAVDAETRIITGTCAFKGCPSADGEVEIAYFTFPKYEGRGYATMMVNELISIASQKKFIKKLFANTLPENNASTRILEKCGMICKGEMEDPEDGKVWRWEFLVNG
jgi:RimJ/RimL family protein N-acetyltransferase